jgi:hypothetical protein
LIFAIFGHSTYPSIREVGCQVLSRLREAPVPLERKAAAYWARGVEDVEELMAV